MKIQVGDYVRTKIGIGKIIKIFEYADRHKDYYTDMCIDDEDNSTTLHIHQILKHSENIIDLIEVGDYVNGYYCRYITDINTGEEHLCNYDLNEMKWIPLKNIDVWESIVTKEQFKQIEYEV